MSKNSNWRANKHTVNNLRLKTWLIGMFVFFTGLNFVLMSLYLYLGAGGNELVGAMGFAGILALLGWPAFAFDDRKEMRGTTGVVMFWASTDQSSRCTAPRQRVRSRAQSSEGFLTPGRMLWISSSRRCLKYENHRRENRIQFQG